MNESSRPLIGTRAWVRATIVFLSFFFSLNSFAIYDCVENLETGEVSLRRVPAENAPVVGPTQKEVDKFLKCIKEGCMRRMVLFCFRGAISKRVSAQAGEKGVVSASDVDRMITHELRYVPKVAGAAVVLGGLCIAWTNQGADFLEGYTDWVPVPDRNFISGLLLAPVVQPLWGLVQRTVFRVATTGPTPALGEFGDFLNRCWAAGERIFKTNQHTTRSTVGACTAFVAGGVTGIHVDQILTNERAKKGQIQFSESDEARQLIYRIVGLMKRNKAIYANVEPWHWVVAETVRPSLNIDRHLLKRYSLEEVLRIVEEVDPDYGLTPDNEVYYRRTIQAWIPSLRIAVEGESKKSESEIGKVPEIDARERKGIEALPRNSEYVPKLDKQDQDSESSGDDFSLTIYSGT